MLWKRCLDHLAKALLLTTLLFGSAQVVIGQNSAKATLLGRADLECRWSLDGEAKGVLKPDDRVRVTVDFGQHLIEATATGGTERFEKMAEVNGTKMQIFSMPLLTIQAASKDFWKDSATGLIWTIKDNGSDVNWNQARDYCGSLRLGGYSDWRLPTIDELSALYDVSLSKKYKAKGPIELSAPGSWSGTTNDSGDVWNFYFSYGGRSLARPSGHSSAGRALCVRRSGE